MTRRLQPRQRAWLAVVALLLPVLGCGGESSVSVGVPTNNNGPVVTGQVSMPNGELAMAPSPLERIAAAVVARVEALVSDTVRPVGSGIEVRLIRLTPQNIVDGEITRPASAVLVRTGTAADGTYSLRLPNHAEYGDCRYMIEVGNTNNRTLTRAFVFARDIDVNFESEAALRLMLEQIESGATSLCDLTADDIRSISEAVAGSQRPVFGDTVGSVNNSAHIVAGSDPAVQAAVQQAVGQPTVPVPTNTTGPVATATVAPPTVTRAPTAPPTVLPTRTSTTVPEVTVTRAPTRTFTPEATQTVAVPTNTVPVSTATNTPAATNTPVATNTAVATNTPRATNTATAVPTNTAPAATATATATATVPPTATATQIPPRVDLGSVAATAGQVVELPATLVTNSATISAVSTDIEYDASQIDVVVDQDGPDCTVDARLTGKTVVAGVLERPAGRKLLRVGVIGLANNQTISSGALFSCRFAVNLAASGAQALSNVSEASSPQAVAIAAAGNPGSIDVTAAPAILGLSSGTAAAGGTADVTASFDSRGQQLAAVATDIQFDAAQVDVADADQNGEPDCTLDAAVAALGKELVASRLTNPTRLRVGVVGRDNNTTLPDVGALFSCQFVLQASTSGTVALPQTAEGSSPAAQPAGIQAEPGSITVVQ